MSHFLYAMSASVPAPPYCSYVKIGHASDPVSRLANHKIGSPIPLHMAGIWRFRTRGIAIRVEGACHRKFLQRCVHGEWHALDVSEVADFVQQMADAQQFLVSSSFNGTVPPQPKWPDIDPVAILERLRQPSAA